VVHPGKRTAKPLSNPLSNPSRNPLRKPTGPSREAATPQQLRRQPGDSIKRQGQAFVALHAGARMQGAGMQGAAARTPLNRLIPSQLSAELVGWASSP